MAEPHAALFIFTNLARYYWHGYCSNLPHTDRSMTERIEAIPSLIRDVSNRQYIPGSKLGAGGFATCWRAKMIDRRRPLEKPECALKVVKAKIKTQTLSNRFLVELQVHSKLRHPNIVEFYRAFTFQENTFIVLELCHNGSLAEMVKKRKYLTMGEIRRFLIQLCGAIKYLHQRDVVHRDIKAGNIFLDENMDVKLGDFGLSAVMVSSGAYVRRTTFCGTPNYLAPEVLNRDGSGHGASVDIWAIGVMAFYMSVGRAPFHSKLKEEIYQKLRTGDYAWPELSPDQNEIPQDLKNLVSTLLVPESQRPTPDRIVAHDFFNGFVPDKLEPLVLSRRPRWARIGSIPEKSSRAYEKLCRESGVGNFMTNGPPKKKARSIVKAIADELTSSQAQLKIPLPEDVLYFGGSLERRPPRQERIQEESAEDTRSLTNDLEKRGLKRPIECLKPEVLGERSLNKHAIKPLSEDMQPVKLLSEMKVKRPRRAGVNYDFVHSRPPR